MTKSNLPIKMSYFDFILIVHLRQRKTIQTVRINFRTGCQDFLIFLIKIFETPLTFYFRVRLIKRGVIWLRVCNIQVKAYLQSESFHLKTFRKSNFFSEIAWVFDHFFFRKVYKWNHYESLNIRLIRRIHKWNPLNKIVVMVATESHPIFNIEVPNLL